MGVFTFGHQAVIRYIEEATPGTTPTNPALLLFSKETQRVRIGIDSNQMESLDIGEVEVDELFSAMTTYMAEVEYHMYEADKVFDFWERLSTGAPRSWTLEVIPNEDAATKTYFRGTGWRANTCRLSGRAGEAWLHTVTFAGGKWAAPVTADPGIGTGSRQAKAAITDALRTFAGGAITLNAAAWAVLLEEFEVTVEHGVETHHDTGVADPDVSATTHGKRKITGTATLSLDDGFKEHWDRIVAGLTTHAIVVPFSTTAGQPKLTLSSVRFPSLEGELSIDQDALMGGVPFQALTYTQSTV